MEQRVLVIKVGKGKIISKPWNFEAMCRCDDHRGEQIASMTLDAVCYLFEGTSATVDYLSRIGKERLFELCRTVQIWYYKDLAGAIDENSPKKKENKDVRLRSIYKKAFEAYGILPKDLAMCEPKDIFYILKEDKEELDAKFEIAPEMRVWYGL